VLCVLQDDKDGRTALHWCVVHGCDEVVKIICEYLKEGVGDSMRVTRFLDAQTLDGETALMLAAERRNGIMCYALTSIGANPNMRNNKGRTAAYLARQRNWSEIADWLEKKVGAGMAKVETFSDLQFEKQHRFGLIKIKDLIHNFGRTYLLLMQNRIGLHPLGCPFVAKANVADRGDRAMSEQRKFMDAHQLYILKRDLYEYQTGKKTDHDESEHQHLKEMRSAVVQMLDLLRAGHTNPNTELEPKPLAWTPLMCAVAVNDLRSIKLMIREGADPNHPNRDGTTAVMLAAQLQNVEALAELLLHKGDLEAVDSQGYNVLSYATSLPLPSVMDRDVVGVLMDGDTDGPRHMTAMELIKIVLLGGLTDLRNIMAEREAAARPEALDTHFKRMQLLGKYGLSAIATERNVHDSVRSSVWRVKEPEIFQLKIDPEKELFERERRNKMLYERMKNKAPPEKSADEASLEDLRCPVCTLQVPCAHFFKVEILKQFLEKKIAAAKLAAAGELAELPDGSKKQRKKYISAKKLRIANRAQEILTEAYLADRNTDRSTLLVRQYRPREIEVAEESARRERMLIEATRQAEEEEQARLEAEGEVDGDEEGEWVIEGEAEALQIAAGEGDQLLLQSWDGGSPTTKDALAEDEVGFETEAGEGAGATDDATVQTTDLNKPEAAKVQTASKLRAVKRLPSKQDLNGVEEGASTAPLAAGAQVDTAVPEGAGAVGSVSTALVVVGEDSLALIPLETETALVVASSTDMVPADTADGDAMALVPVPPPEESQALVPTLRSALKIVIAEAEGSTALVEFKKKRRVKFYFSEEQRQFGEPAPLAITDGSEVGTVGTAGTDVDSEEFSLSSDSTASSSADGMTAPLLITASPKAASTRNPAVAQSAGIAMPDGGSEFPALIATGANAAVGAAQDGLFDDIEIVSTTTTLTSDESRAMSPHSTARAAVDRNAIAGLHRLQDGELPEYLKASSLVNPVPVENRRVFMFTRNTMDRKGRTDGLVHIPTSAETTSATAAAKGSNMPIAAGAGVGAQMPPSGKKKGSKVHVLKKQQAPQRRVVASAPLKVDVSGWIFVSLADIASEVNPLDTFSVTLVRSPYLCY
jgi:hypothetical protein